MPRSLRKRPPSDTRALEVVSVTVTNRIQELLEERNLSQAECAKRIRMSLGQFSRIVRGVVPRHDIAAALECVLKTPMKNIFKVSIKTRRVL